MSHRPAPVQLQQHPCHSRALHPMTRPALSKWHCTQAAHTKWRLTWKPWTSHAQPQRPLFQSGTQPVFQGAAVGSSIHRNSASLIKSLAKHSVIPTDRLAHRSGFPYTRKSLKGNIKTLHLYFTWEAGKLSEEQFIFITWLNSIPAKPLAQSLAKAKVKLYCIPEKKDTHQSHEVQGV